MQVLVVDDSRTQRTLVMAYLRGMGLTFLEATDGLDGIRVARSSTPDLILADLHMPQLDGVGLIRELRRGEDERLRVVPIIVLTAEKSQEYRDEAVAAGANECCRKPISRSDLVAIVDRYRSSRGEHVVKEIAAVPLDGCSSDSSR